MILDASFQTMVFILDVAHFTMRTNGVNQAFRLVEGIWLNSKESSNPNLSSEKTYFTLYVRNILYKYHGSD